MPWIHRGPVHCSQATLLSLPSFSCPRLLIALSLLLPPTTSSYTLHPFWFPPPAHQASGLSRGLPKTEPTLGWLPTHSPPQLSLPL